MAKNFLPCGPYQGVFCGGKINNSANLPTFSHSNCRRSGACSTTWSRMSYAAEPAPTADSSRTLPPYVRGSSHGPAQGGEDPMPSPDPCCRGG